MSMSQARADQTLDDTLRGAATPHILPHEGDPGWDGTANVAPSGGGTSPRKATSFAAPEDHASEDRRQSSTDADAEWSGAEVDTGVEVTHVSIWSASTGGQPEHIAELSSPVTTGSQGLRLPAGDVTVAIDVYALEP